MKEHIPDIRQCDHMRCSHPYRAEYCETEAQDPKKVANVVKKLKKILYNFTDVTENPVRYDSDEAGSFIAREFNLQGDAPTTLLRPREEMTVVMSHQTNPHGYQVYEITTGWVTHQPNAPTDPYITGYAIETWPGSAQAKMSECDLTAVATKISDRVNYTERLMTSYDFRILIKLLEVISDMQTELSAEN